MSRLTPSRSCCTHQASMGGIAVNAVCIQRCRWGCLVGDSPADGPTGLCRNAHWFAALTLHKKLPVVRSVCLTTCPASDKRARTAKTGDEIHRVSASSTRSHRGREVLACGVQRARRTHAASKSNRLPRHSTCERWSGRGESWSATTRCSLGFITAARRRWWKAGSAMCCVLLI